MTSKGRPSNARISRRRGDVEARMSLISTTSSDRDACIAFAERGRGEPELRAVPPNRGSEALDNIFDAVHAHHPRAQLRRARRVAAVPGEMFPHSDKIPNHVGLFKVTTM